MTSHTKDMNILQNVLFLSVNSYGKYVTFESKTGEELLFVISAYFIVMNEQIVKKSAVERKLFLAFCIIWTIFKVFYDELHLKSYYTFALISNPERFREKLFGKL